VVTHGFPYLPMPVGAKAITPAIPDPQYKPGSRRQQHGEQVPFPGRGKNPSHHIEQGEQGVKNKEENIEEGVPHYFSESGGKDRKMAPGLIRAADRPEWIK